MAIADRPIRVTDATFESEVVRSPVPVVVDFYAEWCGPYREYIPLLRELAASLAGRARFVDVNIDEASSVTRSYGIHTLPTFLFVTSGRERARAVGAIAPAEFRALVAEHVASARLRARGRTRHRRNSVPPRGRTATR